MNLTNRNVKV